MNYAQNNNLISLLAVIILVVIALILIPQNAGQRVSRIEGLSK